MNNQGKSILPALALLLLSCSPSNSTGGTSTEEETPCDTCACFEGPAGPGTVKLAGDIVDGAYTNEDGVRYEFSGTNLSYTDTNLMNFTGTWSVSGSERRFEMKARQDLGGGMYIEMHEVRNTAFTLNSGAVLVMGCNRRVDGVSNSLVGRYVQEYRLDTIYDVGFLWVMTNTTQMSSVYDALGHWEASVMNTFEGDVFETNTSGSWSQEADGTLTLIADVVPGFTNVSMPIWVDLGGCWYLIADETQGLFYRE